MQNPLKPALSFQSGAQAQYVAHAYWCCTLVEEESRVRRLFLAVVVEGGRERDENVEVEVEVEKEVFGPRSGKTPVVCSCLHNLASGRSLPAPAVRRRL